MLRCFLSHSPQLMVMTAAMTEKILKLKIVHLMLVYIKLKKHFTIVNLITYYIFKCGLHYLAMIKLFQRIIFSCLSYIVYCNG